MDRWTEELRLSQPPAMCQRTPHEAVPFPRGQATSRFYDVQWIHARLSSILLIGMICTDVRSRSFWVDLAVTCRTQWVYDYDGNLLIQLVLLCRPFCQPPFSQVILLLFRNVLESCKEPSLLPRPMSPQPALRRHQPMTSLHLYPLSPTTSTDRTFSTELSQ
jgi:hypothetical protein